MKKGHLQLIDLEHRFGNFHALDRVSLDVKPGEFVTLLGPSGSGKTTTLKIIAGFILADSGTVLLDGEDLSRVPPHLRNIGMVFQNYALFPHMTVAQNVAFPLEMRHFSKSVIREKVDRALDVVHLPGLAGRRPRELSGGQQQRVALARALVFEPRLLLMDEPLGALDRKLRETMQIEIVRISREVGISVVYVTHDQDEALAMSDRIAVYNAGRIEQFDAPQTIYRRPASAFVAGFVGESTILQGAVRRQAGEYCLQTDAGLLQVSEKAAVQLGLGNGDRAFVVLRPEILSVHTPSARPAADEQRLEGVLRSSIFLGNAWKHVVELVGGAIALARAPANIDATIAPGSSVTVRWRTDDAVLLASDSDARNSRAMEPGSNEFSGLPLNKTVANQA